MYKATVENEKLEVIVIGGGPAGMMAAAAAAKNGARVTLLERNPGLGKKLLTTGGGRCNISNHELDNKVLLTKYREAKDYLYSPFSQFAVKDTISYFEELGCPLKTEAYGRMFPITNNSASVNDALIRDLQRNHVIVRKGIRVKNLKHEGTIVTGVTLDNGDVLKADRFIIAAGGVSHPETGSTGDGFKWLAALGHKVVAPNPVLVPIKTKEEWTHEISGLAYEGVQLKILVEGKVTTKRIGKVLFTHFGLSGPLPINMSKEIWESSKENPTQVSIDLYPKLDPGALDRMINEKLQLVQNKILENALGTVIEKSLAKEILKELGLDGMKVTHQLTRDERKAISHLLKNIILTPTGLLGTDKAIVTSGGLPLDEVDMKTMSSKKFPNLYVVGDMLDIDRPSGGFSLQLCWTTGFVAGKAAAV